MPNLRYPAEKKDTAWLVEFPRQKKKQHNPTTKNIVLGRFFLGYLQPA
jgi:hypothetical protein